jgi:leucine dehydrogenase
VNELFEVLAQKGARHFTFWSDKETGLKAVLVLDDMTLGPAAGGVRTQPYPSVRAAIDDAAQLARAMTLKCSLAGLDAGGGKCVVIDHAGMDRARAFEALGERVEELRGAFHTGTDLGTTRADLENMARMTQYAHTEEDVFSDAVARGLLRCVEACARFRGKDSVEGLKVAVQGCGSIGAAAARAFHKAGCELAVADVDHGRAEDLAFSVGAELLSPAEILEADVDIVAPCALGGTLTGPRAHALKAWAVCGAANNVLAEPRVADILKDRGVLHVPDVIASAGAVCEGIGREVMGLEDRNVLIDRLGETALDVLEEARNQDKTPTAVAEARALRRLQNTKSGLPRQA